MASLTLSRAAAIAAAPAAAPRAAERRVTSGAMRLPTAAVARSATLSSRTLRGTALQCRAPAPAVAGRSARCTVVAGALEAGVGLLANKAGMTSFFTAEGLQVPVTVIALLPGNIVTQARALRRLVAIRNPSPQAAAWPHG